jgi:hypothetical protein
MQHQSVNSTFYIILAPPNLSLHTAFKTFKHPFKIYDTLCTYASESVVCGQKTVYLPLRAYSKTILHQRRRGDHSTRLTPIIANNIIIYLFKNE